MTQATNSLWASLPIPAVICDAENRIIDVNPAAELFLNASKKALEGYPVWDKIFVDAPLEVSFARVREASAPLFVNAVDVGTGSRKPVSCDVQIAPLADKPDHVLVLLENRRTYSFTSLASSARA